MNIYQSQAESRQMVLFDEKEYLIVRDAFYRGESLKQRQNFFAALEISTGQFADNHWMACHFVPQ